MRLCANFDGHLLIDPETNIEKEPQSWSNSWKIRKGADNTISLTIIPKDDTSMGDAFLELINISIHFGQLTQCDRKIKLIDKAGVTHEFEEVKHQQEIAEGKWFIVKNINGFGSLSSLLQNLE